MIGEYYTGWMDYWGYEHSYKNRKSIVQKYEGLMERGVSVTFYMFVGGTDFGLKAAKTQGYPLTTSYDYGAPIAECGDIRPIYYDIRNITVWYMGDVPEGDLPQNSTKLHVGEFAMTDYISLDEVMNHFREKGWLKQNESTEPVLFEDMKQDSGFFVYTTTVAVETDGDATLEMLRLSDRAYMRAGGKLFIFYNHVVNGGEKRFSNKVPIKKGDSLSILVENMGREEYGLQNHNRKMRITYR